MYLPYAADFVRVHLANSYKCTQLTQKTASVVPPEDGGLTPETSRGLRPNKVIVEVKVY
jgi:hypothetical protein